MRQPSEQRETNAKRRVETKTVLCSAKNEFYRFSFVYVSVKIVKKKLKYFRDYFQTEAKKVVKPKSGAAEQEILKTSSRQHYNLMLFLKDLLDSEKSESSLHDGAVSEPTEYQDTSFGYHDGKNSVTEVPYALSMLSTSSRPCSVSSVSSEETINHAGGSRKKKMTLDGTDR
jgi:hypothetical protein